MICAASDPAGPEVGGRRQCLLGVDRLGRREVRLLPGHHERDPLARADREARPVGHLVAGQPHRGAQPRRVGPGDGDDGPVEPADPGDDLAVAEPQPEDAFHLDRALDALDDPHQHRWLVVPGGHEVNQADGPACGLPLGLQDQGVAPVAPAHLAPARWRPLGGGRRDHPVAVALIAQQCGEAGRRVETRQAEPLGRAVHPDQRGRLHVADDRVVLDEACHRASSSRPARACALVQLRPGPGSWRYGTPALARGRAYAGRHFLPPGCAMRTQLWYKPLYLLT